MKKHLLFLSVLMLVSSLCFGQVVSQDSRQESKGETRTKGSYILKKEGDILKLDLKMNVRKSGMSGTGKGAIGFVIFDDNFEPIFQVTKGLTVGARVPQGTNDKGWSQGLTITGEKAKKMEKEGLILAFNVNTVSDKLGVPTSLNEWKSSITEAVTLASDINQLAVGASMQRQGWKFIKLASF